MYSKQFFNYDVYEIKALKYTLINTYRVGSSDNINNIRRCVSAYKASSETLYDEAKRAEKNSSHFVVFDRAVDSRTRVNQNRFQILKICLENEY